MENKLDIMHNRELFIQFKALQTDNQQNGQFAVLSIPETRHKLGVSKEGYPKFFLYTNDTTAQITNTMLNILSVEYNLSCTFVDDNNSETNHSYTIVTLRSVETILQEDFVDLMLLVIARLPEVPSKREIAIEVENLISIFSAMSCPPRKKIQGLWAELLVIEQSTNATVIANAWHENPTSKYDFTMGKDKIEVKSTTNESRIHHFSLEQITPSKNSRIIVASTIVRESAQGNGGLSIDDLYNKICMRIQSVDTRIHILKVIAETLGTDIHKIKEMCFDYTEACDTLRYYDARNIPGVDQSGIHVGVTSVGFNSNLSGVADVSTETAYEYNDSPLYQALFN